MQFQPSKYLRHQPYRDKLLTGSPVGVVMRWRGDYNYPPAGWIKMDGTTRYQKADYYNGYLLARAGGFILSEDVNSFVLNNEAANQHIFKVA